MSFGEFHWSEREDLQAVTKYYLTIKAILKGNAAVPDG